MSSIRRFFAARMGLRVLIMTREGNKGPEVLYKYLKDLVLILFNGILMTS
jgi:hypothetical protein